MISREKTIKLLNSLIFYQYNLWLLFFSVKSVKSVVSCLILVGGAHPTHLFHRSLRGSFPKQSQRKGRDCGACCER